ncbi:MAG: putative patatin/cPLA2 family phospholipase [Candidatus Azotimanducaceae bacterium]|jgi:predicted patatin/cPLA2 family phospholipase
MILEGDLHVIDAIKEKKRLQDTGKTHEHIRPLLVIDGGFMKGAYGVGAALALEELNFNRVFSNVVGVSSGAPVAAYFISGEVHKIPNLIDDLFASWKFLNLWRLWNQLDTKYLMQLFKTSEQGMSMEKVFNAPVNLYIGVAEFESAKPELLRPSNGPELLDAMNASILMPNISTDKVYIDGVRYVDGGFTHPHILEKVFKEIDATHILIMTNQNQSDAFPTSRLERFLNNTVYRFRMSKAIRHAIHDRREERKKVYTNMRLHYKNPHAFIWGDNSIDSFDRDNTLVNSVIEKSRLWWHDLLKD